MKRTEAQRANRKVIEAELRHYQQTVKDLEVLKEEIMECGYGISYDTIKVSGGVIGSPTESRAMKLMTSVAIRETERRVNAISDLIEEFKRDNDPNKLRFIELKYFDRKYTDYGLSQQLNISVATLYRWQNYAVRYIAEKLGFIV